MNYECLVGVGPAKSILLTKKKVPSKFQMFEIQQTRVLIVHHRYFKICYFDLPGLKFGDSILKKHKIIIVLMIIKKNKY